ncbi:MAG: hypothetical protein VXY34_08525, partial [Bdellovibrionota bacterium]|nr:hypothetical protein [Bdellovibrionota bacterium]
KRSPSNFSSFFVETAVPIILPICIDCPLKSLCNISIDHRKKEEGSRTFTLSLPQTFDQI